MAMTMLENLINPEVMAQMISAELPKKIKFAKIAKIDSTLVGQAGDTVTVPKFAYVGDAEDVAEGVAMGTVVLTASSTKVSVKKAGKAVELTDESVLSGYGDPVGEATNQITMALASKIDNDCLTALAGATLTYDGSANAISYAGVVNAVDKFEDESDAPIAKMIFVHPKQLTQLRLDEDFKDINKFPMQTMMTGVVGMIAGCQVVPSKKVELADGKYVCPIVMVDGADAPALTIYMKRDAQLEADRDILKKTTVLAGDEHYGVALSNDAKVVLATFKA